MAKFFYLFLLIPFVCEANLGHAVRVRGKVFLKVAPEVKKRLLKQGDELVEGNVIISEKSSMAMIKYSDGGVVTIGLQSQ
jgi:hypothetical protein